MGKAIILSLALIFLTAGAPATGTFRVIDGEWVNGEFVEWTGLRVYQVGKPYCDKYGECGIVTESYEDSNGAWTIEHDIELYEVKRAKEEYDEWEKRMAESQKVAERMAIKEFLEKVDNCRKSGR